MAFNSGGRPRTLVGNWQEDRVLHVSPGSSRLAASQRLGDSASSPRPRPSRSMAGQPPRKVLCLPFRMPCLAAVCCCRSCVPCPQTMGGDDALATGGANVKRLVTKDRVLPTGGVSECTCTFESWARHRLPGRRHRRGNSPVPALGNWPLNARAQWFAPRVSSQATMEIQSTSRDAQDYSRHMRTFGDKPMGPRERRAMEAAMREAR